MTGTNLFAGCVVAVLILAFALGCGSAPPRATRTALIVAQSALQLTSDVATPQYEAASNAALLDISSRRPLPDEPLAEYHRAMAQWDRLVASVSLARNVMLATDRSLQAWEDGAEDGPFAWQRAVSCLVGALGAVADAMAQLGIRAPDKLEQAIAALAGFGGRLCDGLQTGDTSSGKGGDDDGSH